MKKLRIYTAMLTLALVFGLVLAGCGGDSGGSGSPAPQLTDLALVTDEEAVVGNWNPQTSFQVGTELAFGLKGNLPGGERLVRASITFKLEDGTVFHTEEMNLTFPFADQFTWGCNNNWILPSAGTGSLEVNVTDAAGKTSNTLSQAFTVTP